jgi:endonuclease YncB( thermonuclease family)
MRLAPLALVLAAAPPAAAQSLSGPAVALDGDTLEMGGERIRLFGIDAPEAGQTCDRKGVRWACGSDATRLLADMVAGRTVECIPRDRDIYGRVVASCRVGASDLAGVMVREGLAIALRGFSLDYVEAESRAKAFGMALWGSAFQTPSDYRAANPTLFRAPASTAAVRSASPRAITPLPARPALAGVLYRNCAEARAAGAAPIYRGQPGYRPQLDRDNDGVACEPYRR